LYGAELWPLTVAQKKKLEAAHHKFNRIIMDVSWKYKVSNERVRAQTQLKRIDLIIKEKTKVTRVRTTNGRQQTAKTSYTLGYKRY